MKIDQKRAESVFYEYTSHYNAADEKVRLKIEHTLRVSRLCGQIAQDIGLEGEEADLAWLLGLLHDVGRFEQLRNYGTFNDMESVNHAAYGADILFQEGKIRDYVSEETEDTLLEKAIRFHNAYRLPEGLTEREKTFCRIIRDADKIDILRANIEFPLEEIYNVTTKELRQAVVSQEVLDNFMQERTSLRNGKRTVADSVVNQIAFAFELEYPVSLRLMVQQGYLDKMLQFESDNPVTQKQFETIRECMERFLKRKGVK
ncbi:MAG: HD domain-containing protein [Clostridiales bacterium]|nr:HD domain-containing protein [Clostridiales bacterium]